MVAVLDNIFIFYLGRIIPDGVMNAELLKLCVASERDTTEVV
jgi:hypothetical protein